MTHRPLVQPLAADPEPWSVAAPDTERDAARPGRYRWVAPERVAPAPTPTPASQVRACRQTDPCIVPPPGSDRRGAAGLVRVVAVAINNNSKGAQQP